MNHSELAHKWAHAAPDASRRSGSMSFAGDTLYSYGTPIAKIYRDKRGTPIAKIYRNKRGTLVLLSEHNYSASTSKHLSHARRAVSHMQNLSVPRYVVGGSGGRYRGGRNAKEDHAVNLAYFTQRVADALQSAQRRGKAWGVASDRETAQRAIAGFARYCAHFGIRRKAPRFPETEFNVAAARAERIENPDPATAAKREAARAKREAREAITGTPLAQKRQAQYAARRLAQIDREIQAASGIEFYREQAARSGWRLGFPWGNASFYGRDGAIMLRINAEDIETSMGARVPLAAAPMVWNMVQRTRKQGHASTWERGLKRVQIGDYPLDGIDADGTLHAGCHTIPYSELASMARQLGLS